MGEGILTETGRLKEKFLPAVYFDSSVVIDYWMTEGLDKSDIRNLHGLEPGMLDKLYEYIRKLLKTHDRIVKTIEIREKLTSGQVKVNAVISPLCMLELAEWYTESTFKQIGAEAVGVRNIQKKSKKEIGDYINRLITSTKSPEDSKSIDLLVEETHLNPSYALAHGLQGLLLVNIVNFNLSIGQALRQEPYIYAYIQLGISDIMHILLAEHLGCSYFASFDDDFKRVRQIIKEEAEITLLSSPKEILSIL